VSFDLGHPVVLESELFISTYRITPFIESIELFRGFSKRPSPGANHGILQRVRGRQGVYLCSSLIALRSQFPEIQRMQHTR